MESLRKIFDALLAAIFPIKRKRRLKDVTSEDLRRERIKLEQSESRITGDIEKLEAEKTVFFNKGVAAGSDRQKVQYARKVKELDSQIYGMDKQLTLLGRNLRVLNGVIQVKENERLLKDMGVDGMLAKMDLTEVQEYVDRCTLDGQFQIEQFTKLLDAVDEAEAVFQFEDDDDDTCAILRAMNAAGEAGTADAAREALAQATQEFSRSRKPEESVDTVA